MRGGKRILALRTGGPSTGPALRAFAAYGDPIVVEKKGSDSVVPPDSLLEVSDFHPQTIHDAWRYRFGGAPELCITAVDPLVHVVADLASTFACRGPDPEMVRSIKDKYRFRQLLAGKGRSHVLFEFLRTNATASIGYPLVVKPCGGAYGLGVRLVQSEDELSEYFDDCAVELRDGKWAGFLDGTGKGGWLAESLLEGLEVSVEIQGGAEPRVIEIHEKSVRRTEGHFREDRFVTAPWQLSVQQLFDVERQAEAICRAVNFRQGCGNLEAVLTSGGLEAVELQLCPAGGLVPELTKASRGVDLFDCHIRSYLGLPMGDVPPRQKSCAMEILHAPQAGTWSICGTEKLKEEKDILDSRFIANTEVKVPHADYLGFIATVGASAAEACEALDRHLAQISFTKK